MEGPLLVETKSYLPTLLKLLKGAKKSVDIIEYSFAIGSAKGVLATSSPPYLIAETLAKLKVARGPKFQVRLYLEGHRETVERNRITAAYLKKAGVRIKYGATHAKGFCIDGKYVLFGSTNLTTQSISKNNETNLLFDDSDAVDGFKIYFEHLWKGGKHGKIHLPPPMLADGDFKNHLIDLIDQSKKTLEFSIYFFDHAEIEAALLRAHARGIHVSGFVHDHASFALSYVRRTHRTLSRLHQAGIDHLSLGPNHLFTHSKFIVSDRKALMLGTGNWLVEDVKIHPQLYIRLEDTKIAREMSLSLRKQIKAQGRRFVP